MVKDQGRIPNHTAAGIQNTIIGISSGMVGSWEEVARLVRFALSGQHCREPPSVLGVARNDECAGVRSVR